MSQVAYQATACSGFCIMKQLGEVFLLPVDGMLAHHRLIPPSINFVRTHLNTWVERSTVKVSKCLAQDHNTVSWPGLKLDCSILR